MPRSIVTVRSDLAALPPRAATRYAGILEWARDHIDSAIDARGLENLIADAFTLYDQYCAPIDIPWIPNALEPAVIDAPAKWALEQLIRGFHDLVHAEEGP